jgi:hypothetical protein
MRWGIHMVEKTKWRTEDVIVKSGELGKLSTEHHEVLVVRVGEETINKVVTAPERLQESYSSQADSRNDKTATTSSQHQLRREVTRFLGKRRNAISKAFPRDKATKQDFGIGAGPPPAANSPDSLNASLVSFISAGEAAPAKLAAAGITADDIAKLKQYSEQLVSGRKNQSHVATSAKTSTVARNNLQRDVETAMVKIVTAAEMIFEKQPDVVALFKSTLPKPRTGSRKSKKAETSTPSSTPSSEPGSE